MAASDPDGSVSEVRYFRDGIVIGVTTNTPHTFSYAFQRRSVPDPSSILTAVAIDNSGLMRTSAPVRVATPSYDPSANPALKISAPTEAVVLAAPATFRFEAQLTVSDGADNPVQFYVNNQLVGISADPPYGITVTNLSEGTYQLDVRTTGANFGLPSVSMPISVTVAKTNSNPPVVTLTEPGPGASFSVPATIRLTADAIDNDRRIDQIEFFDNTNSLGIVRQPPYTLSWRTTNSPQSGHWLFYVKASDKLGPTINSASHQVPVVIGPYTPKVKMEATGAYLTIPNARVLGPTNLFTLRAIVLGIDSNINPVEFYRGTNLLAAVPQSSSSLTFTNLSLGQHIFSAKVKDLEGREYLGDDVSVIVTRPPVIRFQVTTDGGLSFRITDFTPGAPLDIEDSLDLTSWKLFGTVSATQDQIQYLHPPMKDPLHFFRVRIGYPPSTISPPPR